MSERPYSITLFGRALIPRVATSKSVYAPGVMIQIESGMAPSIPVQGKWLAASCL